MGFAEQSPISFPEPSLPLSRGGTGNEMLWGKAFRHDRTCYEGTLYPRVSPFTLDKGNEGSGNEIEQIFNCKQLFACDVLTVGLSTNQNEGKMNGLIIVCISMIVFYQFPVKAPKSVLHPGA